MSRANASVPAPLALLQGFLRNESAPGVLLFVAATAALLVANSPLASAYREFLELPIVVKTGSFTIAKPLLLWVNDGLMAIFFLLVGLELKREIIEGELSSLHRAVLPVACAIAGIAAPAAIYAAVNWGDEVALRGWAIPAATDIAFAMGVLGLLGPRIPRGLKVFLLSVAIVDDLGAILIIALFYSAAPPPLTLVVTGAALALLIVLNRCGVTLLSPYLLTGVVLWAAVLKSGVHATLAGALLAMTIPSRGSSGGGEAPSQGLERELHAPVSFAILPLFAFANAGVSFAGMQFSDLAHGIPLGITAGLFLGKQLGVMLSTLLLVALGIARLPTGATWRSFYGVAILTGIGFTMSLFIGSLAFKEEQLVTLPVDERVGVLLGSALAAVAGYLVVRVSLPRSDSG